MERSAMMALKALSIVFIAALLGLSGLSCAQPAPGSCDGQNGNKECFQNFNFNFNQCQCNYECAQFLDFSSGCCADYFTMYGAGVVQAAMMIEKGEMKMEGREPLDVVYNHAVSWNSCAQMQRNSRRSPGKPHHHRSRRSAVDDDALGLAVARSAPHSQLPVYVRIADPNPVPGDDRAPRFVEIFNLECHAVSLDGWVLRRFTDSSSTAEVRARHTIDVELKKQQSGRSTTSAWLCQEVDELLEGTIPARGTYVIAGDGSAYINAFDQNPDLVSFPLGPADVNGEGGQGQPE